MQYIGSLTELSDNMAINGYWWIIFDCNWIGHTWLSNVKAGNETGFIKYCYVTCKRMNYSLTILCDVFILNNQMNLKYSNWTNTHQTIKIN